MADWSTPVLASTYVTVLDSLKNRDIDAAVQFSPTYSTATNLATGTIRWNPTNGYWEIRAAGGTWSALQAKYNIDVDLLDGQHGSYYLSWANLTGVPSPFTPSAHTHDDRYFTETESDARFANKIVTSGNTIKLQTFGNVDLSTITVPYATNAGTVGGFSVGQNLLTTSAVTFAGVTTTSLTIGATAVTATAAELNFVDGVTSNIQTQLNGKQATITGAATSIVSADLTASRAMVSDATGKVAVSAVTATELGYLSGVTSAIQTQINAKADVASPTLTGTVTAPTLRLSATGDAALAGTTHAFQIGPTTGANLIIDSNEIMARSNGAAATLALNADGGSITLGATTSVVSIPGTLSGDMTLDSGFTASTKTLTASTSFTVTPTGSNFQTITNGGSFTITAPSASGNYSIVIRITNTTGAGTVTLSGFTKVTGDTFTTTSSHNFLVFVTKFGAHTVANVVALQ